MMQARDKWKQDQPCSFGRCEDQSSKAGDHVTTFNTQDALDECLRIIEDKLANL